MATVSGTRGKVRAAGSAWIGLVCACAPAAAQAPEGPMAPKPGITVQQPPPEARLKVRVSLVNTPVTVRDGKGQMIHDLDAGNFVVTDNGVTQKITHFDLGGDPLSVVILMETSSRIDSIFPEINKTGILFTQTVMGPSGEAAIVGFNDSVDKLQDFTADQEKVEKTIGGMREGSSGSRLYDAMAVAVEMLRAGRRLRVRRRGDEEYCSSCPKRRMWEARQNWGKCCGKRSWRTSRFTAWDFRLRARNCNRRRKRSQ